MATEPMTVVDLRTMLENLPPDAIVQIHDGYYGIDSELTEWVFVQDATRARLVLGRGDD